MNYFLPGMGATSEMYEGAWLKIPNCSFLDWPAYEGEKNLEQMADKVIATYGITSNDMIWGTSLGGMVACEITKVLEMEKVGLLGSAKHPNEIQALLRYFSSLAKITPISFVQRLAGKSDAKLLQMFKQSDADFIKNMSLAVFNWDGLDASKTDIIRIHGKKDHVIPLPQDAQHIIDGGHLIVMTHAEEIVEIITPHLVS